MPPIDPSPDRRSSAPPIPDETELSALAWMRRAGAEEELLRSVNGKIARRRRWTAAFCAAACAVAAGLFWVAHPQRSAAPALAAASSSGTIVLAPRRESLADGSTVDLKEGAEIAVDYAGPLRRVLLRKGEALFAVAKNHDRPFVVAAGGVEIRAVGTAFSVQRSPNGVEILVTEGRVAVDLAPDAGAEPAASAGISALPRTAALVDAFHRVLVVPGSSAEPPRVIEVSPAEMADRLSWSVPRLELSHTRLEEVIAAMNRGGRVRFVIGDARLRDLKLSGFLQADNADGLVRLLESQFGVVTERRGADEIVLRRSP